MQTKSLHPIIYVRGYAMSQSEIEDTVADPYMGFNLGSTKVRQLWDRKIKKLFFESPLVRLMKQYGYRDVYDEGIDQVGMEADPASRLPYRSLVVYRYYEPSSEEIGEDVKPDIQNFAKGLGDLIQRLRERMYPEGPATKLTKEEEEAGKPPYEDFRVYLVAHSMGGLVCRAFLQNPRLGDAATRRLVDKVFTYATPHNGIDVRGLGNIPSWLSIMGMNTFSRDVMAKYLGLKASDREDDAVDIVTGFDPDRIFNLVGTNPGDYKVAGGLSSFAASETSDGLVRIANATTRGWEDGVLKSSPNAFVNRSHSGHFGIVNSEEGFQNLVRFLFGDVRADGYLDIDELTLPPDVQKERDAGKDVRASYLFEVTVSIRGKQWQLHRRTANENSAIFRMYDELFPDSKRGGRKPDRSKSPLLFNVFLDLSQRVDPRRKSVAFAADICIRVPEYEVKGLLFLKNHFEGGYLFRDLITIEATPPVTPEGEFDPDGSWKIHYQFASQRGSAPQLAEITEDEEKLVFTIPIEQPKPPGIRASLRVVTTFWNR
ncbi:MAG: hypothetical protein JNN07_26720 [Verrucomicrobiales bacterium]|nr:hypothetical protein [Verrucomicrobiales bacterium]